MKSLRLSFLLAGLLALVIAFPACTITPTGDGTPAYSFGDEDVENPFVVASGEESDDAAGSVEEAEVAEGSGGEAEDGGAVDSSDDQQPLEFLTEQGDIDKDAVVGSYYSQKFKITGHLGDGVKWHVTGLPDGLETDENSTKIFILGEPLEEGTFEIEVVAEDELDDSRTAEIAFELTVAPSPDEEDDAGDNSYAIIEGLDYPLTIKLVPSEDGDGGFTDQDVIDNINSGNYDHISVTPSHEAEQVFNFAVMGGSGSYEFKGIETEIDWTEGFVSFFENILFDEDYDWFENFVYWDVTMEGNKIRISEGFGTFISISTTYSDYCLHHYDSTSQWPYLSSDDDPILKTTLKVEDGSGGVASFTLRMKVRVSSVIDKNIIAVVECYDDGHIPLPSDEVPGNSPF